MWEGGRDRQRGSRSSTLELSLGAGLPASPSPSQRVSTSHPSLLDVDDVTSRRRQTSSSSRPRKARARKPDTHPRQRSPKTRKRTSQDRTVVPFWEPYRLLIMLAIMPPAPMIVKQRMPQSTAFVSSPSWLVYWPIVASSEVTTPLPPAGSDGNTLEAIGGRCCYGWRARVTPPPAGARSGCATAGVWPKRGV